MVDLLIYMGRVTPLESMNQQPPQSTLPSRPEQLHIGVCGGSAEPAAIAPPSDRLASSNRPLIATPRALNRFGIAFPPLQA